MSKFLSIHAFFPFVIKVKFVFETERSTTCKENRTFWFGFFCPWRSRVKCTPVRTAPATFRFSIYTKLHRSKTCFSVLFSLRAFSTYTKLHRSKTRDSLFDGGEPFSTYTKLHRSKTFPQGCKAGTEFSTYAKLHRQVKINTTLTALRGCRPRGDFFN